MTSWNLADLFEATTAMIPDRIALTAPGKEFTYRELDDAASAFGRHVIDAGIEQGTRVGILSWNRPEWLAAMIGCFKACVVPVNVNYRYVDDELVYLLVDADAVALVVEPEFL